MSTELFVATISLILSATAIIFTTIEMISGRKRLKAEVFHRLQESVFQVNSFFATNPTYRSYIYKKKEIPEGFNSDHPIYDELMATAELVLDLFDTVCYQRKLLPQEIQRPWEHHIKFTGDSSPIIQYFLFDSEENGWESYTQYLITLLGHAYKYELNPSKPTVKKTETSDRTELHPTPTSPSTVKSSKK